MLRVYLLGHFRIAFGDHEPSAKVTPICQRLLAYLLLERHRSHPRDVLTDLFWPDYDQERARSSLNTALWRLRQALEPGEIPRGTHLLTTSVSEVGLNPDSEYWLDVAVLEAQSRQVLAKPTPEMEAADAQTLESALQLYTGELLEGFYDDWALRARERVRRLYLNGLAHLMCYYKHQRAYQESLIYAWKILDQDPLREEIHREIMRLYVADGQRALALRQYQMCCDLLMKELGIPPMEETRALHNRIVNEVSAQTVLAVPAPNSADYLQISQQFQQVVDSFDEVRTQLQQALQLLNRLAESSASKDID